MAFESIPSRNVQMDMGKPIRDNSHGAAYSRDYSNFDAIAYTYIGDSE